MNAWGLMAMAILPEVALGKGVPGSRFQVFFEIHGFFLIIEANRDDDSPWSRFCCV